MRWGGTAVVAVVALGVAVGCSAGPPEATRTPGPGAGRESAPASAPAAEAVPWVGTWGVAVQSGGQGFREQTLRQIVHTSIGGGSARLRLSHAYGERPLTVSSVHVARHVRGGDVEAGTGRVVTFGGAGQVVIAPGGSVVSDEVDFAVVADGDVAVSMYLPVATGPTTRHGAAARHNYVAPGEQSGAVSLTGARTVGSYFLLTGLDVRNAAADGTVVAFGASITDGIGSRFGANRRWPDLLSDRLRASGRTVGVVNSGISGNRLTDDRFGDRASRRFGRDVLQQPGARWVIISDDAINDIGTSDTPASVLVSALEELIGRGQDAGIEVICSTLTPFRGASYWTERGERRRAEFNAFVRRAGNGCDAVLDLDRATHDPADPTRYRPAFDSGDHLHPNDRGMQAIADAVDLSRF